MESIQVAASGVFVNIALAVVSLLGAYALYGISKLTENAKVQTAQIKDASARKRLEYALADVEKMATVTVSALEQTTGKALREAVKNGKANKLQLENLALKAKYDVAAAVSPEVRVIIAKNLGSFDSYLTKLIEERVLDIKNAAGQKG